ncbi:hypothetical protein P4639_22560 [Priestia megaterium]|uniref:hypothetical protein n=1 Tax=Priestia megaterium TaxID=1404 RepID=UPI002E231B21|nr:hypothetical protein [Priestia megaterium]
MNKDLQRSLIETIQILVDEAINKTEYTSSQIGLVKSIKGFECTVEVFGSETTCVMAEHLHGHIKVGDIVVIQDLHNNNINKFIVNKLGETS